MLKTGTLQKSLVTYKLLTMNNNEGDKKNFMREKIPSMKRRSVHNNYYSRHIYMLTLVVEERRPILGKLVGNIKDEDDPPRIELSVLGKAVQECWENIPKHHPEAKCLGFQIMPDHLHGILFVERNMENHLGQIVSGFKAGCNKAYRGLYSEAVPLNTNKQAIPMDTDKQVACYTASPYSDLPLPSVMRLKKDDRSKGLLFERGYNDLINKNYDMLPRIVNYVNDNPRRLAIKRAYPDFFKVRLGISIGQQTYAGIGNKFLLDYPEKIQVKCSRKLTDEEIKDAINSYLEKARSGAVLVSPAISKGEQAVMRTALNEGLPIIFLTPWGFTAFSKPGHQYFNACADGRLLILAPWEHQTERIALTRNMCLCLNDMATEICTL